MKKFYSFLVAAVVLMGATSCQKEAAEGGFEGENMEFTASIASGRTELGGDSGRKVMWNADDNIRIYTQDNWAGTVFNGDAEAASATAKFTTTESFTASENGYFAVYSEKPCYSNHQWTSQSATYNNGVWSVPVKMQGALYEGLMLPANGFVEENGFMVAYSEDNQLSFKAATAFIKFVHTGTKTWGSFRATGADLSGAATLNYNTSTGEISYTTEGTETYIDFEVTQSGQTCYLPIYPGTVTGFELYDDQTLIAKYDGEFTFKAGVIYNMDIENMPALPETSPYAVMVPNEGYFIGGDTYPMEIVNDYHVAKNVPYDKTGYCIFEGTQLWAFAKYSVQGSGNVALNTWTFIGEYVSYNITFESDAVDIYFEPESLMICIVPAGTTTLPEFPKEKSVWGLVGSHQNWDVANVTTMYVKNGFSVAEDITFASETEFKFVIGNNSSDWTSALGYPWNSITSNSAYSLVSWTFENQSNNIKLAAGTYDIYLATTTADAPAYFVVVDKGNGTVLTSTDIYIHANTTDGWKTETMGFDGTYFVKKGISFSSIEFLFKATSSEWNIKWCGVTNASLNQANVLQMYHNDNITASGSGTYDIYTDLKNVWIMDSGSYPTQE